MGIIPETTLRKLEFDRVLERLSSFAASEPGRAAARLLRPLHSAEEIARRLALVTETKEALIAEGSFPVEAFHDILPALKKTAVENQALSAAELIDIARVLRIVRNVRSFISKRSRLYPRLSEYVPRLNPDKVVEYNIDQALEESGSVRDGASKDLRDIRRSMISAGEALRRQLQTIVRRVSEEELLQEEIITTRDGRLVIPVKNEYRNRVPGFIHSTSASGATVYVEPAESLELNNSLRELQIREQREIHRILLELTRQVGEVRVPTEESTRTLVELDVLIAAGRSSIELIGVAPLLDSTAGFRLVQARHPELLRRLPRNGVIPLTMELGGETKTLVITGPNAGGKTVALKTIGLLVLMVMTGLHIPAASDSRVYPFRKIFADIGDDQSIEDDLSTFSSHLLHLREVLEESDGGTLVLLDEVGAGTDPAEGGALAAATLGNLTAKGAITLATTHHGALKVFAHETPGVVNGSMEFDTETIRPTYVFRAGIPGSSFAFELARRIGIPEDALTRAREIAGAGQSKLEHLLLDLEQQSHTLAEELASAMQEKERLRNAVDEYDRKLKELKKEVGAIRGRAVVEAKELVSSAQKRLEETVRELREQSASREAIRSSRETVLALKEELDSHAAQSDAAPEPPREAVHVGERVRFADGTATGEIVAIDGEMATVLSGQARMHVPLASLRTVSLKSSPGVIPPAAPSHTIDATNEIDVRGLMGDEAVGQLVRFLDNAYAAGLTRVDIIHGKGTGALRKRISEFLKTYPHVTSFRLGEWNEGGAGATVVNLG